MFILALGIGGVPHAQSYNSKVAPFDNPDQHYRSTDKCRMYGILGEEKVL